MAELTQSEYESLRQDIAAIFIDHQNKAQAATNKFKVQAYWLIGRRIVKEEQANKLKAAYGERLLERLSEDLQHNHGNGFSLTNLKYMRQFYLKNPSIGHTCDQLSWSHQRTLMAVKDDKEREVYATQAAEQNWSIAELKEAIRKDNVELETPVVEDREPDIAPQGTLSVTRGKLYTYRLLGHPELTVPGHPIFVDCGFTFRTQIPLQGLINPATGDFVTASLSNGAYTFERAGVLSDRIYTYEALVEHIIDGDTLWANIDLGFNNWAHQKLRLRGIDTPELTTTRGQKAKQFVEQRLAQVKSIIIKTYKSDKYDRYLTDIFYLPGARSLERVSDEGTYLNQELLDNQLAVQV